MSTSPLEHIGYTLPTIGGHPRKTRRTITQLGSNLNNTRQTFFSCFDPIITIGDP